MILKTYKVRRGLLNQVYGYNVLRHTNSPVGEKLAHHYECLVSLCLCMGQFPYLNSPTFDFAYHYAHYQYYDVLPTPLHGTIFDKQTLNIE
jgi:hypothetical protein